MRRRSKDVDWYIECLRDEKNKTEKQNRARREREEKRERGKEEREKKKQKARQDKEHGNEMSVPKNRKEHNKIIFD